MGMVPLRKSFMECDLKSGENNAAAITQTVKQWINETDAPTLLRAIGRLCQEKYDQDSRAIYEKYRGDGRYLLTHDSPEERRAHGVACAFLSIGDLEYLAAGFEKRIAQAGLSREEIDAINDREEIEKLEKDLERKKKHALLSAQP
jgi:hypothetical protein